MKYLTISDLQSRLRESGLPHNKKTIFKWEKGGRLVCPRSTTNYKVAGGKKHYVRLFTEEQLSEIINAFKPGGSGKWSPSN